MPLTHLLYLHGFRSSPASAKARRMAQWAAEQTGLHFECPQLPPSPLEAMALIGLGVRRLSITPASGPLSATGGVAYSQSFAASGGTSPYTYALVVNSGTMPTGLSFNSGSGALSGTPTTTGTVNFTVVGTDTFGCSASKTYAITISCPAIAVTPADVPSGALTYAYAETLHATGGTAPYTWSITSGSLPAGRCCCLPKASRISARMCWPSARR